MNAIGSATLEDCVALAEHKLAGFVLKALLDEIDRTPVRRNGHVWIGLAYFTWCRELGLTAKQLWEALATLVESGLIVRKICEPHGKFPMLLRPTKMTLIAISNRQRGYSTDWAELVMAPGVH